MDGAKNMGNRVEDRIRQLAQPIWDSAGEQYGTALDCWLMAENMVLETMAATTKIVGAAWDTSIASSRRFWEVPSTVPTERIRELAHMMWESAGRQHGAALDFWLAAERHVLTVLRMGMSAPPSENDARSDLAKELLFGSPAVYLERVRELAYYLWLSAGEEYGRSLDFWLEAERQVLGGMSDTAGFVAPAPSKELPPPRSPRSSPAAARSRRPRRNAALARSNRPAT